MRKYKPIQISSTVVRQALESSSKPEQPVVIVQDPKTQQPLPILLGTLFGIRGYCVPIMHPDDEREIVVHHITYYYDVEEMLTHVHSCIRAEGKYWLEQGDEDG